ncbi:MAG: hypothetical protein OXC82_09205, partial [Rhodobacteraceae bacterium]|nr:hypothetical protein [Paracoccaceae bacterium]
MTGRLENSPSMGVLAASSHLMVRPQDRVRCVDGARTPWVFGTCPRGDDGQEWPGDSGMAVRSCRLTARAIDDGGRADMG